MPTTMGRAMVVVLRIQLDVNRASSTKAADKAAVLQLGNDYAFAMEDGHGEVHLCHGRLLQMKRRNKSQMYTPIFPQRCEARGRHSCVLVVLGDHVRRAHLQFRHGLLRVLRLVLPWTRRPRVR